MTNNDKGRAPLASTISPAERQGGAAAEYVSPWQAIQRAASFLKVSKRPIYPSVQSRQLAGERLQGQMMIHQDALARLVLKGPGRPWTTTPRWCWAPEQNAHRLYPGHEEQLASRLDAMRQCNLYCLPKTVARHILSNQPDPQDIALVLVWRAEVMPDAEE